MLLSVLHLVEFTDNVHRGGGHELGAHKLHEVPVGQLRHRVGEGERPDGGHLPAVTGERHLAADRDQGHRTNYGSWACRTSTGSLAGTIKPESASPPPNVPSSVSIELVTALLGFM